MPHCCSVETRVPSRCRRESNTARPTFRPPSPFALKLAQTLRSRSARARLQGHGPAGSSRSAFALASPNLEGEPGGETPAPGIAPPRRLSVRRIQSRTDRLSFGLSSSAPPRGDRRAPAFGLSPPTPCAPGKAGLPISNRRDSPRVKSRSSQRERVNALHLTGKRNSERSPRRDRYDRGAAALEGTRALLLLGGNRTSPRSQQYFL